MSSLLPGKAGASGGTSPAPPAVQPAAVTPRDDNCSASGSSLLLPPAATSNDASGLGGLFSGALATNPIFSAGFGLMVFGAALGIARKGLTVGAAGAQRRMLVSLEITSKDRAYPWFLYWMGKQAEAASLRQMGLLPSLPRESVLQLAGVARPPLYDVKGKAKAAEDMMADPLALSDEERLQPVRIFSHELSVETSAVQDQYAKQQRGGSTVFSLVPGPGTHWFRYHGTWIRMQRERAERAMDLTAGKPFETVKLSTLRSSAHLFPRLLDEARRLALTATQGKTTIFTSWSVEWRPFGKPRRPRELSSVVLAEGAKESLTSDVRHFLERGRWYADRGESSRRGLPGMC